MIVDDIPGIRRVLKENHMVAMVGLSEKWHRPSHFAAKYLQIHGYRVIPVTPTYDEILGEKCYPSLLDIPQPVDVVDCFRKSEEIPALAEQAIQIGAKVLWMQLGIVNDEAAKLASDAGLDVPASYRDVFLALGALDKLPQPLAERLAAATGFRNLVAHQYGVVDARRVHAIAGGDLEDLLRLCDAVAAAVSGE